MNAESASVDLIDDALNALAKVEQVLRQHRTAMQRMAQLRELLK